MKIIKEGGKMVLEKDKWAFISLCRGEVLKCDRCGMFIHDQRINLSIARDEAVIEVVCKECGSEKHGK